jgi:hypothetical protein
MRTIRNVSFVLLCVITAATFPTAVDASCHAIFYGFGSTETAANSDCNDQGMNHSYEICTDQCGAGALPTGYYGCNNASCNGTDCVSAGDEVCSVPGK